MGLFAFRRDYVKTVETYAADAATSKADQRKRPSFDEADKSATPAPAAADESKDSTKAAIAQKDPGNCPMPEPKPVGEEPKAKRGRPKKSST